MAGYLLGCLLAEKLSGVFWPAAGWLAGWLLAGWPLWRVMALECARECSNLSDARAPQKKLHVVESEKPFWFQLRGPFFE